MDPQTIVAIVGAAILSQFVRFPFDRALAAIGFAREDKRLTDGQIARVDQQARETIARVEREVKSELESQGRKLARLEEKVAHLPTADDLEAIQKALAGLDREVGTCVARIEGQSEMIRTIRDHILRSER